MKKSIFVLLAGVAIVSATLTATANTKVHTTVRTALSAQSKDSYAEIKFDATTQDLGKFPTADPIRKCVYTFTNTGTAPLVIHQALASCGCTVPNYPKTPIKPGEKGQIEVTYNGTGKFHGRFQKTITVRTNAKNEVVRLILSGEMTE